MCTHPLCFRPLPSVFIHETGLPLGLGSWQDIVQWKNGDICVHTNNTSGIFWICSNPQCMCERGLNRTCLLPLCCPVFQIAPDQGRRRCFPLCWPHCCVLGYYQPTLSLLLHLQYVGWWHQSVASESATWQEEWCHSPEAGATLYAGWRHCSSKSVRCWDQKAPTTDCHQFAWCKHPVEGPTHIRLLAGWRTYAPAFLARWFPPTPICRETKEDNLIMKT